MNYWPILILLVITVAIIFCGVGLDYVVCQSKAQAMDVPYKYAILSGCFINVPDSQGNMRWIPFDAYYVGEIPQR